MHSEEREANLGSGDVAFAIVMAIAAALLGLAHLTFAGLGCFGDTSTCAQSVEKTGVIEGTLLTQNGDLYRSSEFEVEFASRENRSPVTFHTDAEGRYCIHWASERSYPSAAAPTGEPLVGNEDGDPELLSWRELNGADPPPGCEEGDAGVPWNRADDAESTWQYWLLIALPLAAIAALAAALIGRRTPYALRLFASGGLLFAANLIVFVVLWFVV